MYDRAVEFGVSRPPRTRAADLGLEVHAGHGIDYDTAARCWPFPRFAS
jgi:pyridoxine 5-phosphate synthase